MIYSVLTVPRTRRGSLENQAPANAADISYGNPMSYGVVDVNLSKPLVLGLVLAAHSVYCLAGDAPLFRFEGNEYRVEDASPTLQKLFFDLDSIYFEQRQVLADELLYEAYLDAEAARRGTTTGALAEELIQVVPPGEQEIRAFYDGNASRIGQPYDQVRGRIENHLISEQLRMQKAALLREVKAKGGYRALFETPEPPPVEIATDGFPRKGTDTPKVTIVEFGDYQCPLCKNAAAVMARVVKKYPDDVQVIYMDLPINRSGISRSVAVGAACALEQDRFWEYHDLAFENQGRLSHESPLQFARLLELDEKAFAGCLATGAGNARVAGAEREARRLGLSATPSVYVNGRPLRSNDLEKDLERLIEEIVASG